MDSGMKGEISCRTIMTELKTSVETEVKSKTFFRGPVELAKLEGFWNSLEKLIRCHGGHRLQDDLFANERQRNKLADQIHREAATNQKDDRPLVGCLFLFYLPKAISSCGKPFTIGGVFLGTEA